MAYVGGILICQVCGKKYREIFPDDAAACPSCAKSDLDKRKRKHFKKLDAMTLEERVRRIEEMQFNKANSRGPAHFTKF